MRLFAAGVSASHAHPRDHAPAAEAVATPALRETTLLRVEHQVAARARAVEFVGEALGCCVDSGESVTILAASLVLVLGSVTVDACLEAAVFAGEDSPVELTVEGLEELGAAVHADGADFELLGVPGRSTLATSFACRGLQDGLT